MLLLTICWSGLLSPAETGRPSFRTRSRQPRLTTPQNLCKTELPHLMHCGEMIRPHSFVIPDAKVQDVVLAYLRKDGTHNLQRACLLRTN